jgi:predicted SAM-dependent methyltransferase
LEHFSFEEGERIAREVARVLRPGNAFRIVVPDAELVLRHYFEAPDEMIAWRGLGHETPMEIVNSYFRQRYEHQFLYDWTTMEKMLRQAGFARVIRTAYGKSESFQPIALDDDKYSRESLYVEAFKD